MNGAAKHQKSDLSRWAEPILILITLLVMGRICFEPFNTWDDGYNIQKNAAFLPPTPASLFHLWTGPTYFLYIPLTYTVWGVISWATQITDAAGHLTQVPWAFHTASVAVQLITVLIVFRLLALLDLNRFACFCGAMLFAVHPLQVETIAWASGLRDLLAGAFSLWALQQYLMYAREVRTRVGRQHYFWALAGFVAAVLSKTTALTLPLCTVALDLCVVRRSWRKALLPSAAWLIVSIPFAIIVHILQDRTDIANISIWSRPFIAGDALWFYIAKLLLPIHLAIDYGHTPSSVLASGQCYWNWIIPVSIAIALIAGRKRRPLLLLAGVIFLAGCLPVLGLTEFLFQWLSTTADHYLYFSILGPAIALAWLLDAYPNRVLRYFAVIMLLSLCAISFRQVGFWRNDRTLWQRQIEMNPGSFVAYTNLGFSYTDDGDYQRAADAFARAADLRPNEDIAHNDLANALQQAGRLNDAIIAKCRTLDIERDVPAMHLNWERHTAEMGAFLCEAGRYSEALPYLQTAHAIAPHDEKVTWLLGHATTRAIAAP